MALCTRCGQQTEGTAEFCQGCGGYPGSREPRQPQPISAATGSAGYLRPFISQPAGGLAGSDAGPWPGPPIGDELDWNEVEPGDSRSEDPGHSDAANAAPPAGDTAPARGPFDPARPSDPPKPEEQPGSAGAAGSRPKPGRGARARANLMRNKSAPGNGRPAPAGGRDADSPTGGRKPGPVVPPQRIAADMDVTVDPPSEHGQTDAAETPDARVPDAQAVDAKVGEAQPADAKPADAQTADAPTADEQTSDAEAEDAEPEEAEPTAAKISDPQLPVDQPVADPQSTADPQSAAEPDLAAADAEPAPDDVPDDGQDGQRLDYARPAQNQPDSDTLLGNLPRYPSPGLTPRYQSPGRRRSSGPDEAHHSTTVLPIADQSGAQAPAGRTGSAGAFAPSGPAWLNRASGSQSAVAGSPSWPKSRRAGAPASHSGPGHRASRSDETPVLAEPRGGGGEHARRSFAGRRRWIPVAAAVVLLIACGAGAAFLLSRNTPAGKPSAAASRPGGAGHTTPTPATTTPPSSLVITVVPAVADRPSAPAVAAFLSRYFTAINNHDFAAYKHLFSRPLRRTLSRRDFRHGYGSSVDSGATLHRIRLLGGREIAAVVTFTSHQHRAASPRNSACDVWKISLYLVPRGGGYAIVTPPASYQPAVHSCSGT